MVQINEVKSLLDASPFVPFEMLTTRTGRYLVESPRHVVLTKDAVHMIEDVSPDGIGGRLRTVPIAQVSKLTLKQ